MIHPDIIAQRNELAAARMHADCDALGAHLDRRGIDIEQIKAKVATYGVAVPSWGVGTGGTRFARFPGTGEPRDIFETVRLRIDPSTHPRNSFRIAPYPLGCATCRRSEQQGRRSRAGL